MKCVNCKADTESGDYVYCWTCRAEILARPPPCATKRSVALDLEARQRAACRELGIGEEHAAAIGWVVVGWQPAGEVTVDGRVASGLCASEHLYTPRNWPHLTEAQRALLTVHRAKLAEQERKRRGIGVEHAASCSWSNDGGGLVVDGIHIEGLEGSIDARSDRRCPRNRDPRADWTSAQRAAVSAHWSARLRDKMQRSTADEARRERERVQMPVDAEDLPW